MDHIRGTFDPRIFVGSLKDTKDLAAIKERKVVAVLNVCNDIDSIRYPGIYYFKWGLDDPTTGLAHNNWAQAAADILRMIALRFGEKGNILVHCASGHNRCRIVAALYIMVEHGIPFEEAANKTHIKDQKNWMIDKGYKWK